jgi:exosortase A-associated hydrolase 2
VIPFFFGGGQRRLFGIYTPARGNTGNKAVVLCYPWGQEYFRAHRSMRLLGNMLAAEGAHVLRVDYVGTGDSSGDMVDADLQGWRRDIDTAIDELKDTAGASRVALIGLRLGATLASQVAARRAKDVNALVLWDPVVHGGEYVQEMINTTSPRPSGPMLPAPRSRESGGGYEVLGFPLTEAMASELRQLDLPSELARMTSRTMAVLSDRRPSHDALRAALASRPAGSASVEEIAGSPAWLEDRDTGVGAVPVTLLQRIVRWFG